MLRRLTDGAPRRSRAGFALALLLLGAGAAQAQDPVVLHPDPATGQSYYPIYRAYSTSTVASNAIFSGEKRDKTAEAVNGVLSLADLNGRIDFAAFATCNKAVEENPEVQNTMDDPSPSKLVVTSPASAWCPTVYSAQEFSQHELIGVRTQWALLTYAQNTTFVLDVRVKCTSKSTGLPVYHIDRWTWKIVANVDSLHALIDAMAKHPVAEFGVPMIHNRTYTAQLHALADAIGVALTANNIPAAKAAILDMKSQITSLPLSAAFLDSTEHHSSCYVLTELESIYNSLP